MGTTKTTVFGAVVLLVMAVGVIGFRAHLVAQREACGARLLAVSAALDARMGEGGDALPTTPAALESVLGELPLSSGDGAPYRMSGAPLRWKHGDPQPYLWDPAPHPYIQGVHVLYTDGSVRLEEELPAPPTRP